MQKNVIIEHFFAVNRKDRLLSRIMQIVMIFKANAIQCNQKIDGKCLLCNDLQGGLLLESQKPPSDTRQMGFLVFLVPVLYREIEFRSPPRSHNSEGADRLYAIKVLTDSFVSVKNSLNLTVERKTVNNGSIRP